MTTPGPGMGMLSAKHAEEADAAATAAAAVPAPAPPSGNIVKRNIFTHKPFHDDMKHLKYDKTITLTSTDLPYFSVLCFREKRRVDPAAGDFKDMFKDITDDGWAELEGVDDTDMKKDDFDFLEDLGLAIKKDDTHYISKFAYLFFDPYDGLFNTFDSRESPPEKKERLAPIMRLFLTYILPGRWWRAFYARQYLPDTIGQATMLNQEMLEIEDAVNDIEDEYGLPQGSPQGLPQGSPQGLPQGEPAPPVENAELVVEG